jgi:hypothetical protein
MNELKTINILAYGQVYEFWLDAESARVQAARQGAGFEARTFPYDEDTWYIAPVGTTSGAMDAAGKFIGQAYFDGEERSAYYSGIAQGYVEKHDEIFKTHCAIWHSVDPLGLGSEVPADEYMRWAAVTRLMCENSMTVELMAVGIQRIYRDWQWADGNVSLERTTALAETFAAHR